MADTPTDELEPRFADGSDMRVVGLAERYTEETVGGIPGQWARFAGRMGAVRERIDTAAFGLFYPVAEKPFAFDYVTGVMVAEDAPLPDGFVERRLPSRRHAVFTYRGSVAGLRPFAHRIFRDWLPLSGHRAAGAPLFTEVYEADFDPDASDGIVEVWMPLAG